nr:MAG TPA: hypothetical protein [Caudoviricetes sp.]
MIDGKLYGNHVVKLEFKHDTTMNFKDEPKLLLTVDDLNIPDEGDESDKSEFVNDVLVQLERLER